MAKTTYRVYEAADGCDLVFCGEFETRAKAESVAKREPAGLERSLWDTARAAGHCDGMHAPEGGIEDDEPETWQGNHYVVRVLHDD